MTLKIRKLQRDSQSVLLLVHDRSGASHELIEQCARYLSEVISGEARCSEVLAQPQEQDNESETDSNEDTESSDLI